MVSRLLRLVFLLGIAVSLCPIHAQISLRSRAAGTKRAVPYFPLQVGNSWTYVMRGFAAQGTVVIRVTANQKVNHRVYYLLEGYAGRIAWVRVTETARVVELDPEHMVWRESDVFVPRDIESDPDTGTERLWYDFGGPPGGTWRSEIPLECVGSAMLAPGPPPNELPEGFGPHSVAVNYLPTICADAGLLQEVFVPGIGLVRRTMQTIGGPREMVLVEAVVGSTIHPDRRFSVALSLDRPRYVANLMPPVDPERAVPVLRADLIIRNTTIEPLQITTPSGQQFDFEIRNEQGDIVYRWSDGRAFTQAVTTIDLSLGVRVFSVEVPLSSGDATPLPVGRYTIHGWVATANPNLYRAQSAFDIEHVF